MVFIMDTSDSSQKEGKLKVGSVIAMVTSSLLEGIIVGYPLQSFWLGLGAFWAIFFGLFSVIGFIRASILKHSRILE